MRCFAAIRVCAIRCIQAVAALACLGLALLHLSASAAEESLRIGRNGGPAALFADAGEQVLRAAYAKLGIVPRFEEFPLLRSLVMADNGTLDGDLMRIAETVERYPNLIRIEVPINYLDITSYARAPCPALGNWAALRGKRVAYIRGVLAVERRLGDATAVPVENMNELFRVLERGMVDVAVGTGLETDREMLRHKNEALCKVPGMLERTPLYHHLNKRHAQLAARLTEQLRAMSRRGEIDAILQRERAKALKP
jgi:polar amino acid transport system substrate-binding protein